MSLSTLIVDDEEYSRKSLYFLLQEYCPDVSIEGIAKSVAEARLLVKEQEFDLVFLDIAMPKENGFELIPSLGEPKPMVVFTTAYDQYALKAIKASAIDYLLKPIDIEELKSAVTKAAALKKSKAETHSGDDGMQQNKTPTDGPDHKEGKITLPNNHGFSVIDTNDIIYIEADSNYSVFHLRNEEKVIASKPLKEFEEILKHKNFARTHKSVIINFKYVKGFSHKNSGQQVILSGDITLPVSRRRSNEFQEKAKVYFKG